MSEDSNLLNQAISGNIDALESILHAHHARLSGFVAKQLPAELQPVVDAEDLVQDTYFEVCRLIGGFKPTGPDSFFAWIATIARHRVIDLIRKYNPRAATDLQDTDANDQPVRDILAELAIYRRTPSRSAASHEFMAALERAVERLPENYRSAVTYRHLEGLDVNQTAQRMQTTAEQVYTLCHRALKAIRQDLRSASLFQ